MIRISALLTIATLVGCGHGAGAAPSTRPPAAFVTTGAGTHRMTLGTYCWTARNGSGSVGACADGGDPVRFPGLAGARAHRGETIVIRLGFTPTKPVMASIGSRRYRLPAHGTVRLHVRAGGLLEIDASRGSDDVSYYAHLRVVG
jgi:hypothetical protein